MITVQPANRSATLPRVSVPSVWSRPTALEKKSAMIETNANPLAKLRRVANKTVTVSVPSNIVTSSSKLAWSV